MEYQGQASNIGLSDCRLHDYVLCGARFSKNPSMKMGIILVLCNVRYPVCLTDINMKCITSPCVDKEKSISNY